MSIIMISRDSMRDSPNAVQFLQGKIQDFLFLFSASRIQEERTKKGKESIEANISSFFKATHHQVNSSQQCNTQN